MAKTLTLSAKASVTWDHQNVDATAGNTVQSNNYQYSQSFTSGTAASQVDLLYVTSGTIVGAGTLNVDLAGGISDFFGATITMARFKVLYVESKTDTTSTSITVGGHATLAVANWITSADTLDNDQPKVRVRNGGCLFLSAPDATAYVVTATTEDILLITNADATNTATYKLAIAGCSA